MITKQAKLKQKYEQIYKIQEFNLNTQLEKIREDNMQGEKNERNRWYVYRLSKPIFMTLN